MKTTFAKGKPKEILYRSYKHFDDTRFRDDLRRELYSNNDNINVYSYFENTFFWEHILESAGIIYDPMKEESSSS